MDTEKRKKILWVVAIVVLLIIFLLWVLRTSDNNPDNQPNTNEVPLVFVPPSANIEYKNPEVAKESPTEFSAINLAKSYAARFGSWSTDNQGNNLKELLPLSTTKMQNYLKNIKIEERDYFLGFTTKSLTAKIVNIDDSSANILVGTQKIETNDKLEQNIFYQDANVILVKSADTWLVDEFIWN